MRNVFYVRQLNSVDFNKVKVACVVALNELGQLEELDNALDSKISDLSDLIDVELVLNTSERDLNFDLYELFCPYDLYNGYEIDFGIENFENSLNDNLDDYIFDLTQMSE